MQQLKPFRILLVGDNCRDEYHFGDVDRISPEAPVPIFKFKQSITRPGMAANVEQNLKALGCDVTFLRTQMNKKIRLIDDKSKYHIARIDHDLKCEPAEIDIYDKDYDAVVISDYNKGTVSYQTIDRIQNNFNCPIFLDTKKTDAERFSKCFLKINATEYNKLESYNNNTIVTRGSNPVIYQTVNFTKEFTVPQVGVHDVCGAGDTFLAALTYEYLRTDDMEEAIKFAIKAATVTIQYLGTHAPSIDEIMAVQS